MSEKNWKKFIPACMAGNVLELYEFTIYGYFAVIIGQLFFPSESKYVSLIAAFSVFAAGSMMRPFSAMAVGYIGDKFGRRIALILSIGIMAISTLSIGLLPTYSQIGIAAPLILILFRMGQGLFITSEEVGATLFLMENAPENEKGYASSFILGSVYIGLLCGSLMSVLIFSTIRGDALINYGWRIPFIIGGIVGLYTFIVRIKQPESSEFKQALLEHTLSINPLKDVFKKNYLNIFRITLLTSLFAVAVYLFAIYFPNAINATAIHKYTLLIICSFCFALTFLTSVLVGKWVDKIGAKIPLFISTFGFLFLSYPLFVLLFGNSIYEVVIGYMLFAVLLGITAGSIMFFITQSFPLNIRFTGTCLAFSLSMSIFGGTAPLLALYITNISHSPLAPSLLLIGTSLMTLVTLLFNSTFTQEKVHGHSIRYQNG